MTHDLLIHGGTGPQAGAKWKNGWMPLPGSAISSAPWPK